MAAESAWVDAGACDNVLAIINLGDLGGGTATVSFMQARDENGDGAKPVTAWGTVVTDENAAVVIRNNNPELLDTAGGFRWVCLRIANAGGTGALLSGTLHAAGPRFLT